MPYSYKDELVPAYVTVNGRNVVCGRDGVELVGIRKGVNEIVFRACGKTLAPQLIIDGEEQYDVNPTNKAFSILFMEIC